MKKNNDEFNIMSSAGTMAIISVCYNPGITMGVAQTIFLRDDRYFTEPWMTFTQILDYGQKTLNEYLILFKFKAQRLVVFSTHYKFPWLVLSRISSTKSGIWVNNAIKAVATALIGGGVYSYIRVTPYEVLLKSVVWKIPWPCGKNQVQPK